MNCLLEENDYERYKVHLPLSVIFKKEKNRFIFGELEKLHPCFSQDFCFDAKDSVCKKGISSDVVVINKFKLAEYRERFPDGRLFLEKRREVFISEKNRKRKWKFLICSVSLILCVVISIFEIRKNYLEKTAFEEMETEVPGEVFIQEQPEIENQLRKIFAIIQKKKGFLDFISWEKDGYFENCKASVNFLFPEDFEEFQEINISNVKFINEKPQVTFELKKKNPVFLEENSDKTINRFKIRKVFLDNGFSILEEDIYPLKYRFISKGMGNSFFLELEKVCEDYELCVKKISLKGDRENGLNGEITLVKKSELGEGLNLGIFKNNINLFENKNLESTKNIEEDESFDKKTPVRIKIGEVSRSSGKKICFFKDENGKIYKQEY